VLRLITYLPLLTLLMAVPILLAVLMVFTCVPQVLSLLFNPALKSKASRKLKSIVLTSLVNVKRHLGSTLHHFLTSTHDVANTPLLSPSKEQIGKRHSKRKALDRMFFVFLLMGNCKGIGARRASYKTIGDKCASFKSSQEPFGVPQVVPQDLTTEMLPPWDNIPKTWSQRLQDGEELMKFDPDNVMPIPESVNPTVNIANPANWLLQSMPSLPNFQVPKLFVIDEDTGSAILCMARAASKDVDSTVATFDADSELVGTDNRSSVCMSPHKSDFIGKFTKSRQFIKAFGGTKAFDAHVGTLKWVLEDDQGVTRTVYIPNSCCIPEAPARLLSPQHWAQEAYAMSDDGDPDATCCETFHNRAMLCWGSKPHVKMVPIDSQNVFAFGLKSGFTKFSAFCTEVSYDANANDYAPDCTDNFLDDESVTSVIMDVETLDDLQDLHADDASSVSEGVLADSEGEAPNSEGEEVDLDGEKPANKPSGCWMLRGRTHLLSCCAITTNLVIRVSGASKPWRTRASYQNAWRTVRTQSVLPVYVARPISNQSAQKPPLHMCLALCPSRAIVCLSMCWCLPHPVSLRKCAAF